MGLRRRVKEGSEDVKQHTRMLLKKWMKKIVQEEVGEEKRVRRFGLSKKSASQYFCSLLTGHANLE
jgi:hypothetical protein